MSMGESSLVLFCFELHYDVQRKHFMLKTRTNFESQGNLIFPSPQDDYSKEEYGETDQRF